jgi:hypothetical protein
MIDPKQKPERNRAIIEAMIHASIEDPELIDELKEMAAELNTEDNLEGIDMTPIDPAAKDRLAEWIKRKSRASLA